MNRKIISDKRTANQFLILEKDKTQKDSGIDFIQVTRVNYCNSHAKTLQYIY